MENMKITFENQLQSVEGELRKVAKERNKLFRSRDRLESDLENAMKELKAESKFLYKVQPQSDEPTAFHLYYLLTIHAFSTLTLLLVKYRRNKI